MGPAVRILFPPAASLEQTGSALFLSLQTDDEAELAEVYDRLARAGQRIVEAKRTRALPALARPCSRRFAPLSSGEPVRPGGVARRRFSISHPPRQRLMDEHIRR